VPWATKNENEIAIKILKRLQHYVAKDKNYIQHIVKDNQIGYEPLNLEN